MGLSSSSVRLLSLTCRKNDIGRELTQLSNEKMSLTRDMQKVSKEYNQALNSKVLKWSNNGGVSYVDLSYDNLMKPGVMNQNKPYMLTDQDGKIVVDDAYKKYAERISPNGNAGENWSGETRLNILSEVTGIDKDKIATLDAYTKNVWEAKEVLDAVGPAPKNKAEQSTDVKKLLEQLGSNTCGASFNNAKTWAEAYANTTTGSITVNSASSLKSILEGLGKALNTYLPQTNKDGALITQACDSIYDSMDSWFTSETKPESPMILEKKGNELKINVAHLIDQILGAYVNTGGKTGENSIIWIKPGAEYNKYLSDKSEYDKKVKDATDNYDSACQAKSQVLTGSEETLLNFYDGLFSTIAEKGWTHNSQVNDTQYLNQMLQNNAYTLTSLNREEEYNEENGDYYLNNEYTTSIASNMNNIFAVNDSETRSDALVDYEYKKSIINAKETKVDLRMQDLQTEQSAINQMIQGIEQQMSDNIDRTMNIFTG